MKRLIVILAALLLIGIHAVADVAAVMPEKLDQAPCLQLYYIEALDAYGYYAAVDEAHLVAEGSILLQPVFLMTDSAAPAELHINVVVARRSGYFSLHTLELNWPEQPVLIFLNAFDASADGFFADEAFPLADAETFSALKQIAASPEDDYHATVYGRKGESVHFSLTDAQKMVIVHFLQILSEQAAPSMTI